MFGDQATSAAASRLEELGRTGETAGAEAAFKEFQSCIEAFQTALQQIIDGVYPH